MAETFEARMKRILERLGLTLKVKWIPKADSPKHGEICGDTIFVYDLDEDEAWLTFLHEVFEFKLDEVTRVYRSLINGLIESYEKLVYERKEKFLEFLPKVFEASSLELTPNLPSTYSRSKTVHEC